MTTIYTLELENNKYYVGRSNIPKQRIIKHFQEAGSEWTRLHKPINVLSQINGDEFDEEKYTLIAMEKYGIDNVRGGSYCKINLTQHDKDKALQTIRSIRDKCYKCGKKGHFAKDCSNHKPIIDEPEYEEYCNKCGWNHYAKNECDGNYCGACYGRGVCYWSDGCYGSCFECCCIDCGEKNNTCICHECDKCKEIITNNDNHICYLCNKCNEYSPNLSCVNMNNEFEPHCKLCIECNKYNSYVSDISNNKCFECCQIWCVDCFSVKTRCVNNHTGEICCILGDTNCENYHTLSSHIH